VDAVQVLSVHEAADALGVSMQRVRQLIKAGQIPARRSSAGWLIPSDAVAERSKSLHQGRPPAPQTAWSVIALLSAASDLASQPEGDQNASAISLVPDRKVRHRVLRALAGMPDPAVDDTAWRRLLSSRGRARRLWAHPGVLDRLAADPRVSVGGVIPELAEREGRTAGAGQLQLYVGEADADEVVRRYRMRDDRAGQVSLVIVPSSVPAALAPRGGHPAPAPAAAADLLEDEDPRARHAGVIQLRASLRALQALGWLDRAMAMPAHREGESGELGRAREVPGDRAVAGEDLWHP
jgi:excisionase family DNA binding protein